MKLLERETGKESAALKKIEIGTADAIAEETIHDGEEVQIGNTVRRRVRRLPGEDHHLVQKRGIAIINHKMDNAHNFRISNSQFKITIMSLPSRPSCLNQCRCK